MKKRPRPLPSLPLDIDRIAAAAISVADKHGVSGFTIRAVAKVLRVTPMALYYHVKNKAELAALAVTATIMEAPLASPTGHWKEDICEMALWIRRGALAHPALHELQRSYRIFTPAVLQLAERWLYLWMQSGLDQDKAVLAAATSRAAITGLVAEESLQYGLAPPQNESMAHLSMARLLLTARHDPKAMFELGVRSVIDGLYSRLSSSL
jgi:TetR/AcrR family transcriptional regulator, tetracycline repressor protein